MVTIMIMIITLMIICYLSEGMMLAAPDIGLAVLSDLDRNVRQSYMPETIT
jgi:hypothetical protein